MFLLSLLGDIFSCIDNIFLGNEQFRKVQFFCNLYIVGLLDILRLSVSLFIIPRAPNITGIVVVSISMSLNLLILLYSLKYYLLVLSYQLESMFFFYSS